MSTPTNIPEVYDPATNSWSTKAPDPITRGMAAAITVGNTIYVAGGWINNDSNTPTPAVSAYNPIANTWTSVSNMPRSRGEMAYGYINGKIYFTGGGASFPNVNAQTDIWDLYDQYVDVGRGHALSC